MRKRFSGVAALVLLAIGVLVLPAWGDHDKTKLRWFSNGAKVSGTSATLERHSTGVSVEIKTRGLEPGHTMTVWWVAFNDPSECSGDCGEDDLGNEDVGVTVAYAAGGVVDPKGRARFHSFLPRNDISGTLRVPGFLQDPPAGLDDPDDAEVHMVVRSHGPVIADQIYEQTHTFGGGCSGPLPPNSGDPGPNTCEDLQFAVFKADDD